LHVEWDPKNCAFIRGPSCRPALLDLEFAGNMRSGPRDEKKRSIPILFKGSGIEGKIMPLTAKNQAGLGGRTNNKK